MQNWDLPVGVPFGRATLLRSLPGLGRLGRSLALATGLPEIRDGHSTKRAFTGRLGKNGLAGK